MPAAKGAKWWLYVLECHSGVLYTGIAKNVEARFEANPTGKAPKSTRLTRPAANLGRTSLRPKGQPPRAEYALKRLPRAAKLRWCAAGLGAFIRSRSTRAGRRIWAH